MKLRKHITLFLIAIMAVSSFAFAGGGANKVFSVGSYNTYVIKADGSLWGWGRTMYIGNGEKGSKDYYQAVKVLDNVKSVSTADNNTVAVKNDGTLWGWGSFGSYLFEGAAPGKILVPTKMKIDDVKMAAAGDDYVLALKNDGTLWAGGAVRDGMGEGNEHLVKNKKEFVQIADNVKYVTAPTESSRGIVLYVKNDNTLWGYGHNSYGLFGAQYGKERVNTAVKIMNDVQYVSASNANLLAIRTDGSLWGCGSSGMPTVNGYSKKVEVPTKIADNVIACAANFNGNGLFVKADHTLWQWGKSFEGNRFNDSKVPNQIATGVKDVACSQVHIAVLKDDNTLWTAGSKPGIGHDPEHKHKRHALKKLFDNVLNQAPFITASGEVLNNDPVVNNNQAQYSWAGTWTDNAEWSMGSSYPLMFEITQDGNNISVTEPTNAFMMETTYYNATIENNKASGHWANRINNDTGNVSFVMSNDGQSIQTYLSYTREMELKQGPVLYRVNGNNLPADNTVPNNQTPNNQQQQQNPVPNNQGNANNYNQALLGKWAGAYVGRADGEPTSRNITIDIQSVEADGSVKGVADFNTPTEPDVHGKYNFTGKYNASDNSFVFQGRNWAEPKSFGNRWTFANFDTKVLYSNTVIEGIVHYDNSRFIHLKKVSGNTQDLGQYSWDGAWKDDSGQLAYILEQKGNAVFCMKTVFTDPSGTIEHDISYYGVASGNKVSGRYQNARGEGDFVWEMSADGKSFKFSTSEGVGEPVNYDFTLYRNDVTAAPVVDIYGNVNENNQQNQQQQQQNQNQGQNQQPTADNAVEIDADGGSEQQTVQIFNGVAGVTVMFEPTNAIGYRIYRSEVQGELGISVTDFYITSTNFTDVNVKPNTTYYYTLKEVLEEAKPLENKREVLGNTLATWVVTTPDFAGTVLENQDSVRHFIMLKIDDPMMSVDGQKLEVDPGRGTAPIIVKGRTMVPIRAIVEAMGGNVQWDGNERKVTLNANGNSVAMWIDKNRLVKNGEESTLDVAPTVINGRTFVPLRFGAQNLNCQVDWINSTRSIVIVWYN